MPKEVPIHHENMHGVCDYCYEEWPCSSYLLGRPNLPGGGIVDYIKKRESEFREAKSEREAQRFEDAVIGLYDLLNLNKPYQIDRIQRDLRNGFVRSDQSNVFITISELVQLAEAVLNELGFSDEGDSRQTA